MTTAQKSTIAGGIINLLNAQVKKKNKELCKGNLHSEQTPLHGFEMLLKLTMMSDSDLNKIARATGL